MIFYSELSHYFPPILNFPRKNMYEETDASYSIYKSQSPLKLPPAGEVYNIEILEQLYLIRKELYNSNNEDELKNKLINLMNNWGPNGLNILNNDVIKIMESTIKKIEKKNESMEQLIELAKILTDTLYQNINNDTDPNIKPRLQFYKKEIDELTSKMQKSKFLNESKLNEEKLKEEKLNEEKLNQLLELLKIDNERIKKQTNFYKL